jgi:hypothetical protein
MFAILGLGWGEIIVLVMIGGLIFVVVMVFSRGSRSAGTEGDLRAEVERLRGQVARLRDQLERMRDEADGRPAPSELKDPPPEDTGIKPT